MNPFKKAVIHALLVNSEHVDESLIEIPSNPKFGDYSYPCFKSGDNPSLLAEKIANSVEPNEYIESAKNVGPYVNFYVNRTTFANHVLKGISSEYGKGQKKDFKTMIEFCQVNTHKAFHVGHLRGTFLGSSLVKIHKHRGYETLAANYQGDIGAHVAKVIWFLVKNNQEYPEKHRGRFLGKIYQKATKMLDSIPEFKEDVSTVLQDLEAGEEKLTELWKLTRKWSLDDFEEFYKVLGVKFDRLFFESEFEKPGKKIVQELLDRGLAEKSRGAVIIDLKELNKFLLLKTDGTALYSTKDLALAREKFEKFDIEQSIHVVGAEQKLYFEQLFRTLEMMGFPQAKKCRHIPYGLVNLAGGKISSREGELIYAEEFVEEIISLARSEINKRHKGLLEKEIAKRAHAIGLGALKFAFLNQDNNKEIIFEKEKALSFEGETGPYVQYTYARLSSILRKAGNPEFKGFKDFSEVTESEHNIAKHLYSFPHTVSQARKLFKPSIICRYLLDLSQMVNEYYHSTPILKAENMGSRLWLASSAREVIGIGLALLGIEVLEEM